MAIMDDFQESKITVKKTELLLALVKNREGHRAEFLEAQHGFREAVIAELDKMLADARDLKPIRLTVSLPTPEDHTKDYDRVIRMLEMSVAEEIQISEQQFSWYVLNEWGWIQRASVTNSMYTKKG
jgi:hypothetical protein